MNKTDIRLTVNAALEELGFDPGLYAWKDRPNTLEVLIVDKLHTFEMRSGMSRRRLNYTLGVIDGLSRWAPRNKPQRKLTECPEWKPAQQIDLEELLI